MQKITSGRRQEVRERWKNGYNKTFVEISPTDFRDCVTTLSKKKMSLWIKEKKDNERRRGRISDQRFLPPVSPSETRADAQMLNTIR